MPPIWNRGQTKQITSLLEWCAFGKPAKEGHWLPGASALETARNWLDGNGEQTLRELLEDSGNAAIANLEIEHTIVEEQTRFDQWPGGRRNHDILVVGKALGAPTVVSIEGKVNEEFGSKVSQYVRAAKRLQERGKKTNRLNRITELAHAFTGKSPDDSCVAGLRYQLFSGAAGTLAAAEQKGSDRGVFLVHEFITPRSDKQQRERNRNDLIAFVTTAFGSSWTNQVEDDRWLIGPLAVHGGTASWRDRELWIGHMTTKAETFTLPESEWRCPPRSDPSI